MGLFGGNKTPEEILAEGRELYSNFKFEKAIKVLEKASGTLDGEPDYWLGLAYMYSHKNDVLMRRHFTIAAEAGHEEAAWLLEILFHAHTFTAEEAFANGSEAFKNQKYKEALDWWEKADARGSAHAALQLGMLYQKGQIVKQDMKKALEYYLKAAELGNVTAQCMAGLLYSQGKDGIEQDRRKAFNLYRRAAERGYDTAQLYLAFGYVSGDGGVKDYAKGLEWLQKCIAQNGRAAESAKAALAKMGKAAATLEAVKQEGDSYYKQGIAASAKKNYDEAIRLWEQAAARGIAKAYRALIRVYSDHNTLIPERMKYQDYEKAIAWDKRALEHGVDVLIWISDEDEVGYGSYTILYADVLETIADVYKKLGRMDEAIAFAKACHQKGLDCEWRLMKLYLELGEYEQAAFWAKEHDKKMGGHSAEGTLKYSAENIYYQAVQEFQKKHFTEARELAKNAIILGNTDAMLLYGTTYDEGFCADADKEKVLYWYKKAAEKGLALAQSSCAEMYCKGVGLDRQYTVTGLYWYEKAAAQGMLDAQKKCAEIYMEGTAIKQDKSRARYWYEKAAEQGDAFAQAKCADLYLEPPVSANYAKIARMYYEKAAAQTEKPKVQAYAKKQLASMARQGM